MLLVWLLQRSIWLLDTTSLTMRLLTTTRIINIHLSFILLSWFSFCWISNLGISFLVDM